MVVIVTIPEGVCAWCEVDGRCYHGTVTGAYTVNGAKTYRCDCMCHLKKRPLRREETER